MIFFQENDVDQCAEGPKDWKKINLEKQFLEENKLSIQNEIFNRECFSIRAHLWLQNNKAQDWTCQTRMKISNEKWFQAGMVLSCVGGLFYFSFERELVFFDLWALWEFLDNKICTFKSLLSWRFPRKTAFWDDFPLRSHPPPSKTKILFRLALSGTWIDTRPTFHRTTEVIPRRPWKSTSPFASRAVKICKNERTQGVRERLFLHSFPSCRPVISVTKWRSSQDWSAAELSAPKSRIPVR